MKPASCFRDLASFSNRQKRLQQNRRYAVEIQNDDLEPVFSLSYSPSRRMWSLALHRKCNSRISFGIGYIASRRKDRFGLPERGFWLWSGALTSSTERFHGLIKGNCALIRYISDGCT
jgi:hypothetical protein